MDSMFYDCDTFNQPLNKWDISNVNDMRGMFFGCESFNQNISKWDVSEVKNKSMMFFACYIEETYKPKVK
jgi:surface protein